MRREITARLVLLLALACGVGLSPACSRQQGTAPQPVSGFVTTADGVGIHYLQAAPQEDSGRSASVLFVPGWTMPADIWEHQVSYFSKTRRVVAMDPRSQGLSSQTVEENYPEARARDIKAVVDQLKLAPVVLVGWSMGVTEVVAYVSQFGEQGVAGLVLVDGSVGWDIEPALAREIFDWAMRFQKDRPAATRAFVREMYRKPQTQAYYDRITQASLRTPTNTAMALLLGAIAIDLRPELAKIKRPTLIVAAPSPELRMQEDMHKRIAGSRLELFENAGHALFVDEAERFNRLLDEFLKTIER